MDPIEVVLFDLGGVLIELGGVQVLRDLGGIGTDDEVWRRWLECRWVRSFERGDCSPEDFSTGMVRDWALTVTPAEFLTSFTGWPRGPYPGAEALVDEVRATVPVGCLSNTNALHWERHRTMLAFVDRMDHRFLSFELRLLKPDRDLFDRVAELVPAPRDRVLFLDDNAINVDGARAAGFRAERTQGTEEATAALVAAGVLAPTG